MNHAILVFVSLMATHGVAAAESVNPSHMTPANTSSHETLVPIPMFRNVRDQLAQSGEIRRDSLSVTVKDRAEHIDSRYGVLDGSVIADVAAGSPAERAGLNSGDIVLRINGVFVHNAQHLRDRIKLLKAGRPAILEIERDGQRQTITIMVGAGA
jgi:S1-C subfamily serine protease